MYTLKIQSHHLTFLHTFPISTRYYFLAVGCNSNIVQHTSSPVSCNSSTMYTTVAFVITTYRNDCAHIILYVANNYVIVHIKAKKNK